MLQVLVLKGTVEELEQTVTEQREQRTLQDQHYTQLGVTIKEQQQKLSVSKLFSKTI